MIQSIHIKTCQKSDTAKAWNSDCWILESIKRLLMLLSCEYWSELLFLTCRCAPPQSGKLITHFLNRLPDRSSAVCSPYLSDSQLWTWNTINLHSPRRTWAVFWQSRRHGWWQEWWSWWTRWRPPGPPCLHLTWGRPGTGRFCLAAWGQRRGRLIREQSQPDVDLSRRSPMWGRAEVNKCKKKRWQQWTDSFIKGSAVCLESITHRPAHYRTKRVSVRSWK